MKNKINIVVIIILAILTVSFFSLWQNEKDNLDVVVQLARSGVKMLY